MMVCTMIVNRSVGDPRRILTIQVPIAIGASLAEARRVTEEAASKVEGAELGHAVDGRRRRRSRPSGSLRRRSRARLRTPERPPVRLVLGRHGADFERADRDALAELDLVDALEPALAQEAAEPARHDDREFLPEPLEGGQIEMVVVRVRDQDRVDAAERLRVDRHARRRCATGSGVPDP